MKYISKLLVLFAIVTMATACKDDIEEVNIPLSVSTPAVSAIKGSSAAVTATAEGSHITYRGICFSTSPNPTINDNKITAFSKNISLTITGLQPNTTYYLRGYAQTSYEVVYSGETSFTTTNATVDTEDDPQAGGPADLKRVSVHDPSIVWDPTSNTYYVFGSHRAAAKSKNLMSWEAFQAPWATAGSNNAANADAFTTPQVTKMKKGGKTYDFTFDAFAWSKRGNDAYNVDGNMWAPDVIYNKRLGKWCMYLSINGDHWLSSIILLTSDRIEGPYRYQAPVVMSGFRSQANYEATDAPMALGETTMPGRYNPSDNYGNHWPNAIDPCVFYDEEGKLWMSYGSWSGGIFMLELDEETGLRDYDVTYAESETSDPYFGRKIAGGHYVSGEASYIEYVGGYYFLFVTYGGLEAAGGYQMRMFRSQDPDGPYVDSKGSSAIFNTYLLNFGAGENDGNRGVNIFGAYNEWGYQVTGDFGERAQGHNSIIAAEDGRTYLVYHTRFQNRGEGHEVRVHQVYQNEEGWLVAAPFEYTGEGIKSAGIAVAQKVATADIPGTYKLLTHQYGLDHAAKEYAAPVDVTLNADGTISGGATGSWTTKSGTSYITIKIGSEFKGVMVPQTLEPTDTKVPCFTALDSQTGVTIWGYKAPLKE